MSEVLAVHMWEKVNDPCTLIFFLIQKNITIVNWGGMCIENRDHHQDERVSHFDSQPQIFKSLRMHATI